MNDFSFTITNHIATLTTSGSWTLEVNMISWNGRKPTYDIRKWSPDHSKMSKGLSLSEAEYAALANFFQPTAN